MAGEFVDISLTCYVDKWIYVYQEGAMANESITRWTVSVSRETDIAVRSFLAQRGMKKGDLSKFIEDAVKWRVFEQTVAEARGKFVDLAPEALDALLDEAVTAARQTHPSKAR